MLNIKKWTKKTEFYLLITIILLSAVIQVRSGQFLTGNNLIDLARSMIIPALFAIGAYMVLISGGIDVSFTAIASLAMFATTHIFLNINYSGSILLPYIVGAGFGLLMGALNAILIAKFKFQTLIVTLGTSSIFIGIMEGALAAHELPVPPSMLAHGKAVLF
jgi:simple sugar transport system permease protein